MMYGIKWPGDVKRIALKIERIKRIRFKPKMNSKDPIIATIINILKGQDLFKRILHAKLSRLNVLMLQIDLEK